MAEETLETAWKAAYGSGERNKRSLPDLMETSRPQTMEGGSLDKSKKDRRSPGSGRRRMRIIPAK